MSKSIFATVVTETEQPAEAGNDRALTDARDRLRETAAQLQEVRSALERAQALRTLLEGMSERLCHLTLLGSLEATRLPNHGGLLPLVEALKGLAEQSTVALRGPDFEPALKQLLDAAETASAALSALDRALDPAPTRPTVIVVPPSSSVIQVASRRIADDADDRLWTKVVPRTTGSN